MDLEFSPEQEQLRAAVRAVLSRECPPSLVRAMAETDATGAAMEGSARTAGSDRLWARMVDLDWPALTVPADCGGLGGDFLDLAIVAEELGRATAPGPFLATVSQFAPVVRELGTDQQRQRFLGPVATGTMTGTLALAERSWAPEDVTLVVRSTGEGWVLDGIKRYVIEGGRADEVAVVGRDTDGQVGVWVVPQAGAAAAMTCAPVTALDDSRQLATLRFDGVAVGPDRRLGLPGVDIAAGLERALQEATTAFSLEALGTCQTIFDLALRHAMDRQQFGVPIGSFQAVKHRFADLLIALERARATCYFAAATIVADDERRRLAVAMAKAALGECQRFVAQEGIQLLGGIGYTWEHDMHLFVKRVKTADALFGSASVHRAVVASLIGLGPPNA
jgi:alkylation response protein AidB-like acyl-CoA dehydrogenase